MNNQENLVSVVMPAYNCERHISDAIKSVLFQTYPHLELIVIDDCSTDNTRSIIEEFASQDTRVRFFKNEKNMGVAATRNRGISLSTGNWIAFLDSDDMWERTKLQKQINYANEKNAKFLYTGVSYINEVNVKYKGIFQIPDRVSFKQLLKQNVIACSSVLIRKCFFDSIKMERDDIHEDFGTWLRILKIEQFAYGINEPLLIYRISIASKSGNKIKSVKMTYKTYRFIGLNLISSYYYLFWYVMKNLKKYNNIFK